MKSMKVVKKDARGQEVVSDSPYPYGLSVSLENPALDRLEMKTLPGVGDVLLMTAKVLVTSVSENKRIGKSEPSRSVGLQITDMDLTSDKKED